MDMFASINVAIEFVAVLLVFATIIGTIALSNKGKEEKLQFIFLITLLGISALANGLYFIFKGRAGENYNTLIFILKFIWNNFWTNIFFA